jgi:hypothetical protein
MTNHANEERNLSFSSQTRPEFLMTDPTDRPVEETAVVEEKVGASDAEECACRK